MTLNKKSRKVSKSIVTYKDILVAPLDKAEKPLYINSYFSGIGGFDKGAKRAGFQTLVQSDWWEVAGKSFELNIPSDANLMQPDYLKSEGVFLAGPNSGDITKLNFNIVRKHIADNLGVNLNQGDLDVIIGGPPCQGYSKSNTNKKKGDPRNELIFDLLRIINETKPKVAMIEQVPTLITCEFIEMWNLIKLRLNCLTDYRWDYKVMNAKYYGARQSRERLIIMLVRRDLGVAPSFPLPQEPDLNKVSVHKLLPHVYHHSPGQFMDGIKNSRENIFCTMTATGSEYLYGLNGKRWNATVRERLILSELEGLNLKGIGLTASKKLIGNMVQVSFAEALFKHIKTHILRA